MPDRSVYRKQSIPGTSEAHGVSTASQKKHPGRRAEGSVALIITLGKRLFSRAVGLIAGSLLAFSAYQVWYSQEAKMYTLITLLALASIYFLRRAVEEGRLRFWIGVVICTSIAIGSHILAALLIPVQVIVFLVWWPHSRRHLIPGVIALACVTLPYLPLGLPRVQMSFQAAETGFTRYTLGEMLSVLGRAYTSGILSTLGERIILIATGTAAAPRHCPIHGVWAAAQAKVTEVLKKATFEDLARQKN